ncbi:G-patch domain and KOW motifs-containing protein [Clupea harengus]|uniref:G-patch domain and KOW motifs-containing protein n=1 Tax=Clupea harengus TaxID=7950 RepID=A0A6P3VN50_CLUHA|nr:G-patch domain and KOW motifs-containing protein [Clupea harengus]
MASPRPEQGPDSNIDIDARQNDEGKKAGPISFGFNKTINKAKSSKEEERDFLIEVEGKELKSTKPVEKPTELIIPLIRKNRWYKQDDAKPSENDSKENPAVQEQDSVESQAVKELIEESRKLQEQWKNDSQADPNMAIPLLMQNQAPEGFEDGDLVKVDLRPESSTDADYDRVPVEAYGMAMIRGMGWKAGEGIGRTFKQDIKPIEHQLRPRGLGLGADRSSIQDLEPGKPKRPPKPGDERKEEEQLVLGPGGFVLVQSGAHKELYGKIEGVDPDNARVVVKLAIGGRAATISQHSLRLVTRKEYDKNSKDLSRLGKAHKEKEKEKEKEREKEKEKEKERERESAHELGNGKDDRAKDRLSERDRERDRERDKDKDRRKDRDRDDRKRKHQESSSDRDKPQPPKESRIAPPTITWLQRDLTVRFIDKAFKGGRYYNSKMRVEDVSTPYTCVCRTEEGRLLDDVKQAMLETIVPKKDTDYIMVVLGQHRGQVGRILRRDKEKCRVMVQLDRYEEQVFTMDYDSICHYVGGVDH